MPRYVHHAGGFIHLLTPTESPRWLLKKHRYVDAYGSFVRLRSSEIQAARDMYYAHRQIVAEQEAFGGTTFLRRAYELFAVPRLRRATLAGSVVMTAQQYVVLLILKSFLLTCAGFLVSTSWHSTVPPSLPRLATARSRLFWPRSALVLST